MKLTPILGAILILGAGAFLLLPASGPPSPPGDVDLLSSVYGADRVQRVAMLGLMDQRYRSGDFTNPVDQSKWHNEQSRGIILRTFQAYTDAVAVAIDTDRRDPEARAVLKLAGEWDAK